MFVQRTMFVPTLYCFVFFLASVHHLLVSVQGASLNNLGIHHGTDVPEGRYPYMVSIRSTRTGHVSVCGATIVNDNTLLTAAHCLWDKTPDQRLAYIGHVELDPVSKGDLYPLVKFIIHPKYSNSSKTNDVGLVKLGRKIDARLLKKVCLAGPESVADGDRCIVPGWGLDENKQSPNHLKQVSMPIIPFEKCSKHRDSSTLICTGFLKDPRDTCQGDSGGPLLCPTKQDPDCFIQFGVNSFSTEACGEGPSYMTKVSQYTDWIVSNAQN